MRLSALPSFPPVSGALGTLARLVAAGVAAAAATACHAADPPTAPAAPSVATGAPVRPSVAPRRPVEVTRRRLEQAAAGLLYTSESDYPFDYVHFAGAGARPLDASVFRAAAGIGDDELVEERTLDDFFARHIERVDPGDPVAVALVPRYRRLRRVVQASLHDVRVFRVGRIVVRCYVVGVDGHGNLVGLATTAIET